MIKIPQSLTTVTLFSKILAIIILVLIIPLASFYAGMQYQKTATIGQLELPTTVTHTQQITSAAEKSVRDYLAQNTSSTALPSQRLLEYKIYHPQNLLEKNHELIFQITFSVKPFSKQAETYWLSRNGVLQPNGWITGKKVNVQAVKKNGVYQVTSITSVNTY